MPEQNTNPNQNTDSFANPERIRENVSEVVAQNNIPDIQKEAMNHPLFREEQKPQEMKQTELENISALDIAKDAVAPMISQVLTNAEGNTVSENPTAPRPSKTETPQENLNANNNTQNTPTPASIPPQKTNSFLWIFGGFLMFLILGVLVGIAYFLSSASEATLKLYGITAENLPTFVGAVHWMFFGVAFCLFLGIIIAGFIYANSTRDPNGKHHGLGALIFSGIFLFFTIFAYIPAFQTLAGIKFNQESSYRQYIRVNPEPAVGSAPFEVNIDASRFEELKPGLFYEWDFGDGSDKGNGASIRHIYEKPGIFSISLVVSDGKGTLQTIGTGITVTVNNAKPRPIITPSVTEGPAPLRVDFDASKSEDRNGRISEYHWEFGDTSAKVNASKGIKTTHIFEQAGTYEVVLTLIDNNNEKITETQTIIVTDGNNGLTAKIVASPKSGPAPLSVEFNGSGSTTEDNASSIVEYSWNFGDNTKPSRAKITKHTYSEPGTYEATLTIKDSKGKTTQETVEIEVSAAEKAPKIEVIASPRELIGKAPFKVLFDATGTKDKDGQVTSFEWDISDHKSLEYGEKLEYTFEKAGQYIVVLKVKDNDNNESSKTMNITVENAGPQKPIAKLKTDPSPAEGIRPLLISFDASASSDPDGEIISYEWDFGDGSEKVSTSTGKNAHKFDRVGKWPVTVTITDESGLTASSKIIIAVNSARPFARAEANRLTGSAPFEVVFTASGSTGNIKEYDWNFGDGSEDKGLEVSHSFENPGAYTVNLIVTDEFGQSDVDEITIVVN